MRFRCTFCSYIIPLAKDNKAKMLPCPSCGKNVIVPTSEFEEGCIIADFEIKTKIGEGSIGKVYKAIQISLDRVVALKILSHEYTDSKGINDFLKEARAAAKLSHTNIVQALAVGAEDGKCYMAMNYITGETLKARIMREGTLPIDESLHIIQQVAEALYYAWDEARLIHRDVKPDNIMITDEGIVKLTDLGLAMEQAEWSEDMEISGSPSYMSPEQFAGEQLDSRSDIYSLGVTLYQMLSGDLPFNGETLRTLAGQHFEEKATPVHKLNPQVPLPVSNMVKKMMAKFPEERYKSLEDLLNTIWRIRQKTAPDKELVPDVHTISINRLDYTMQNLSKKEKELEQAITEATHSIILKKSSATFKALIVLIICVIAAVIIFLSVNYRHENVETELSKTVEAFKARVNSGQISETELIKEGQKILNEIGEAETPEEHLLSTTIRLYITNIVNRRLQEDTDKQMKINEALEERIINLTKHVKDMSIKSEMEESKEKEKLSLQLRKFASENKLLKEKNRYTQSSYSKLKKSWETDWQQTISYRYYSMATKGRLKEASAMIKMEFESKGPEYRDWFDSLQSFNSELLEVYTAFTDSGAKCAGLKLTSDKTLQNISGGFISYQDKETGEIREKPWNELPVMTVTLIALDFLEKEKTKSSTSAEYSTVNETQSSTNNNNTETESNYSSEKSSESILSKYPKEDVARISSAVYFLKGEYGKALAKNPEKNILKEISNTVLSRSIQSLLYIASIDKKKAAGGAKMLISQIQMCDLFPKEISKLKEIEEQGKEEDYNNYNYNYNGYR